MINSLIGLLFLVFYLSLLGFLLRKVLVGVFHFENNWRTFVLGAFFGFWVTSSVAGVAVTFFKFSSGAVALILGVTLIIASLLHGFIVFRRFPPPFRGPCVAKGYAGGARMKEGVLARIWIGLKSLVRGDTPLLAPPLKGGRKLSESLDRGSVGCPRLTKEGVRGWSGMGVVGVILFLILDAIGFYLLASSKTGLSVSTPWQIISPFFIYVFAGATLVLGLLIYWTKSPWLLILLVVHSFLLHSYLPLTHDLIYGADGWRHIASEARILDGNLTAPAMVTDDRHEWGATFLIGKLAYSQLWGVSVVLAKVTGIGLIEINKWLLPVLWSLFVPILLFEIGKSLGWSARRSLLLVWLAFLPYALQAGGSFTLPVNLGFISWLFLILLMLKRVEKPEPRQILFLFGGGVLLVFGYTLFTILFWVCWLLLEVLKRTKFSYINGGLLIMAIAVVFPLVEWVFGYSGIRPSGFLSGVIAMVGNFTGYYLANGPRPHVIAAGNVIFNQTPTYAFVVNLFTGFRWWLVFFMVSFLATAKYGWIKSLRFSKGLKTQWLMVFSAGLFLSYVISRYFLLGEHLLTRRFEVVLAFLLIILVIVGLSEINFKYSKVFVYVGLLVFSGAIAASFSLGPNTGTVSTDQYRAMQYVNGQIGGNAPCVLAQTYPLLALQAISKNRIVGGGFPIDSNFSQPELETINYDPKYTTIYPSYSFDIAFASTGAKSCWIVGDKNSGFPEEAKIFGSVAVWRVSK